MNIVHEFEVPENVEVIVKLVDAIPPSWSWVDGFLKAPQELIKSDKVAKDTAFNIQRFHSIKPTIIGITKEREKKSKPDFYAVIAERKLPHFVCFDEAGYGSDISLGLAKKIMIAYLRKGYLGKLLFFSNCYDNSKYQNPETCRLFLERRNVGGEHSKGHLEWQGRIEIGWKEVFGGKEENLEPMISVCRSLSLRELTAV